jgi:hypothetical protein
LNHSLDGLKKESRISVDHIPSTYTTIACVDVLAIITNGINAIQPQIHKLQNFAKWSHMDLLGCPNKTELQPNAFKAHIQSQNITY